MTYLVILLVGLGLAVGVATLLGHKASHDEPPVVMGETCATCDGTNSKCEQECMMEAAVKDIEYFDDEELDTYRQRPSDQYTDDETEQFREVLYTMSPNEVKDWCRSLTLRGIELPNQLKDEVFALIEEE